MYLQICYKSRLLNIHHHLAVRWQLKSLKKMKSMHINNISSSWLLAYCSLFIRNYIETTLTYDCAKFKLSEPIAHEEISHGENEMTRINNLQKYQLNNYAVRMESRVMIVGCAITQAHLFYGYLRRHDMRLRRSSHC